MQPKLETARPCALTELVKGSDQHFVVSMTPLVRNQSVSLDLSSVERIDAAGITALISVYRIACESGHAFSVSNVSARVAEMLALVGLDRILLPQDAKQSSPCGNRFAQTAA
jgi:anti-anti-sigma factor